MSRPETGPLSSHVVAEQELLRVRLEEGLGLQVPRAVLAQVVAEERHRDDEGHEAPLVVGDRLAELRLLARLESSSFR